jgi:hypothetical protein
MIKNRIIGILNLLFGIPQAIISLFISIAVLPNLNESYSSFNVNYQSNMMIGIFLLAIIFILAVINMFIGVKNLSKKLDDQSQKKYFRYGIISTFGSVLLTVILTVILINILILPIYGTVGRL